MFQSSMGGIRAPARIGFRIGILTCILSSMTYHKIHMISDISFLFNIRNNSLSYLLELSSAEPHNHTFPVNSLYSAAKNCLSLREACHGKTCIFQSCNTCHHRSYHRRTKHQSHTNRRYTSCLHFGRLQIYDLWDNISWNKVALGIQCSIFIHISCRQTCKVSIPCISCIQKKPYHNTSLYKTQDYGRAGTCIPSYWIAQTARAGQYISMFKSDCGKNLEMLVKICNACCEGIRTIDRIVIISLLERAHYTSWDTYY